MPKKVSEEKMWEVRMYQDFPNPLGLSSEDMNSLYFTSLQKPPNKEKEFLAIIYWCNVDDWIVSMVKRPIAAPNEVPLQTEFLEEPKKVWFHFNDFSHFVVIVYDSLYFWNRVRKKAQNYSLDAIRDYIQGTQETLDNFESKRIVYQKAVELKETMFPDKDLETIISQLQNMK